MINFVLQTYSEITSGSFKVSAFTEKEKKRKKKKFKQIREMGLDFFYELLLFSQQPFHLTLYLYFQYFLLIALL